MVCTATCTHHVTPFHQHNHCTQPHAHIITSIVICHNKIIIMICHHYIIIYLQLVCVWRISTYSRPSLWRRPWTTWFPRRRVLEHAPLPWWTSWCWHTTTSSSTAGTWWKRGGGEEEREEVMEEEEGEGEEEEEAGFDMCNLTFLLYTSNWQYYCSFSLLSTPSVSHSLRPSLSISLFPSLRHSFSLSGSGRSMRSPSPTSIAATSSTTNRSFSPSSSPTATTPCELATATMCRTTFHCLRSTFWTTSYSESLGYCLTSPRWSTAGTCTQLPRLLPSGIKCGNR